MRSCGMAAQEGFHGPAPLGPSAMDLLAAFCNGSAGWTQVQLPWALHTSDPEQRPNERWLNWRYSWLAARQTTNKSAPATNSEAQYIFFNTKSVSQSPVESEACEQLLHRVPIQSKMTGHKYAVYQREYLSFLKINNTNMSKRVCK